MRVLIADDFEDMRELLEFIFASELGFAATLAKSGREAVAILETDPGFDLVICDMNMPNGSGLDVWRHCEKARLKCPFVMMSGDAQEKYPHLHSPSLRWLKKPFDVASLTALISETMRGSGTETDSYVPVSLALLSRMQNIEFPLFIRINEQKYVKATVGPSTFDQTEIEKYQLRGLRYMYIESMHADEFIASYRKKVLSMEAWQSAIPDDTELVSINTELMLSLSSRLGWGAHLVELAKHALNKALVLVKHHPSLNHVFNQFHKIERFGFSDHCTMSLLVAGGILKNMGYSDEITLAKMTFAAILHDMSLTDDLYTHKSKLIKRIQRKEKRTHDMQAIFEHPLKAAELCRGWNFCPPDVDLIIANHHERPQGDGFPKGIGVTDLDFMCSAFIVAEDFSDFFIEAFGKPDLKRYLESRRELFSNGHFRSVFRTLEQAIELKLSESA